MSTLESYWSDKVVLVTGASSGLGWAIVEALAPYGIHFGLLSRRREKLQALASKLRESGSSFWLKSCDVRNREEVVSCVKEFHRQIGRLDVAWINSGISRDTSFENWRWENMEDVIDTNLKGAIYTTQACLEIMAPQKFGAIVGIGSAASMRGLPRRSIYSLSKIGLDYYLQSLTAELPDIQFTVIHPGFVDTPINAGNPNRFWMLTPEKAAKLMVQAVARRKRLLIFPFRMRLLYRLIHNLPRTWYFKLARKLNHLGRPMESAKSVEAAKSAVQTDSVS
ncbi:MAG: SDR family NAD(P)-dependent oxidoreductase [bacterium]